MKKSEYSGKFGDYSSFSEEYDTLDVNTEEEEDTETQKIDDETEEGLSVE